MMEILTNQDGVDERFVKALDSTEQPTEPDDVLEEEPEAEVPDEQEDQPDEEEEVQEEARFTIKHNGEDKDLAREEIIELAQKGFDYTQKSQDVAEQRKALEAERQAVSVTWQLQQDMIHEYAQMTAMDQQLTQYQNVDWDKLEQDDPLEAQKHWRHFSQLKEQRNQVAGQAQAKTQHHAQLLGQQAAQLEAEAVKQLRADIKDWDTTAKSLRDYALSQGYSPQDLKAIMTDQRGMPIGINYPALDPRMMKVLHKAYLYDQLKASKPKVEKRVSDLPKVTKPGSGNKSHHETEKNQKMRTQLKKTGDAPAEYFAKFV